MIVDVHTHIWNSPEQFGPSSAERIRGIPRDPWDRPDASPVAYDRAMAGVDYAFVLGFVSRHLGAAVTATQVASRVAQMPEKYLGFAGIDPTMENAASEADQARGLGLVGVTISPAAQNIHPTDARVMKLLDQCQSARLPVIVQSDTHMGASSRMEFSQPYHWDEIAGAFPKLRIVLAQVGYPWVDQTLVLLAKHPHLYADLSDLSSKPWQLYHTLASAHERGVTSKLFLGSDFPFSTPDQAARNIYRAHTLPHGSALPVVPREVLRQIVERDALACLGIVPPMTNHALGGATAPARATAAKGAVE